MCSGLGGSVGCPSYGFGQDGYQQGRQIISSYIQELSDLSVVIPRVVGRHCFQLISSLGITRFLICVPGFHSECDPSV